MRWTPRLVLASCDRAETSIQPIQVLANEFTDREVEVTDVPEDMTLVFDGRAETLEVRELMSRVWKDEVVPAASPSRNLSAVESTRSVNTRHKRFERAATSVIEISIPPGPAVYNRISFRGQQSRMVEVREEVAEDGSTFRPPAKSCTGCR
jgi:hypothetical protein